MSKLATITSIISTYNEVQSASDKNLVDATLRITGGNKLGASLILAGSIGAGIAMNVAVIKQLRKRGYKRTASFLRGMFVAGVAVNTVPYIRIAKLVAEA